MESEKRKLYIETVGCQMNVLDSEMVVASLRQHGYEVTPHVEFADAILFNTCSVREQAENKTYSALGRLRGLKQRHPEKIIGVMGCMAQKDQELIFRRAPFVDLIVGPGQLQAIPDLIEKVKNTGHKQSALSLSRNDGKNEQIKRSHETFDPLRDPAMRPTPFQAYLRIQIGCDKFCTYCVVPNTRGPEQGRPPEQIVAEAQVLADQGCKEITLLGQTVNSYTYKSGGQTTTLADLLERIHPIQGIERIKFVTNYPKDMSLGLLHAVRDLPKVSPYLHVPLQSGSNEVLKRMKRGYTVEDYRDMMARIREHLPNAAVSSDFIVGFCGETEDEFQKSIELITECRFKNSFIFKYSARPGTKAHDRMIDDVPYDIKQRRNNELLAVQNAISLELNLPFVGTEVQVLVEGPSKRSEQNRTNGHTKDVNPSAVEITDLTNEFVNHSVASHGLSIELPGQESNRPDSAHQVASGPIQLTGRTHDDRIVVFQGNPRLIGEIIPIGIYEATPFTLLGTVITLEKVGSSLVQIRA
ncbi:MAG TPA: tRNA (N6-isopentenyl adenosine(37)-C2)-methylthiotransferase MiaB [Pirellulaceae bacterium]|nr:tRNA (N6-isopentenyl adenosine(37)-C2)-methylthiotransferase MiaB [Pirellulaceae bacterium]HMO93713.1 tRNA (N6-isopentenyl adenosine(37)-C2)-methylthiotransferase MiaB [Pirellulaceae bacterium]HMP69784.1 tRNA (N6-isopentenyl adenosine(37)-C2)-methylthiotransferase MiaB [Pirellulaceae bacterium]